MSDLWTTVKNNSTLLVGDFWDHITHQRTGTGSGNSTVRLVDTYEVEMEMSIIEVELESNIIDVELLENLIEVELEDDAIDIELAE